MARFLIRADQPARRISRQQEQFRRVRGLWVSGGVAVLMAGGIGLWATNRLRRVEHPELPGVDVRGLDDRQLHTLLAESQQRPCTCGCGFTLADCRQKDPTCRHRRPILQRMARDLRNQVRHEGR